ncbi:MAG TPA: tetratricopeptide repeat protein [Candidatus Polarisedimenticolia bacterium]|jgi:tetratricopeptide (TPR) repeat protein|nr:tetratricopeptide repeat protein [Candidatus Polarisedimenticolia bacterium]
MTTRAPSFAGTCLLIAWLAPVAASATGAPAAGASAESAGQPALSPAETQIRAAQERIAARRADSHAYLSLAAGLTRRARETGDGSYYDRALEALAEARRVDPESVEAARTLAWVRMGRHEFARARTIARRFAAAHPDDDWNLGTLGDAAMELGRYDEAEEAFQRMVDLRPGPAAYTRAAYLRETRGDLTGALELMQMSLQATGAQDPEDRAWLLVQIGHLHEVMGEPALAESSHRPALAAFPRYHYALAALAELALAAGRALEAVDLATEAIATAPHAERYLVLADALRAAGRETEAHDAEDRFETAALADTWKANENHDLVLFYLDRRPDPPRALEIARREARMRRDVQTLDRLACARLRTGDVAAARRLMRRILKVGTRDPLILRHAQEMEARGRPPL